MDTMTLNCFEESNIKNKKLPKEWQSQESLDELADFLQQNWSQRSVFFDDGIVTSRQQYLSFIGQKGIRTNNYVGTVAFKGKQLNIFPKVFREDKDDTDTEQLDLDHLMKNLTQWIQYCNRIEYPFLNISSGLENTDNLRELFVTLYLHYVKKALDRGAFYRYEEKNEDLSVVKGHINYKDYINSKIPNSQSNKFQCSFSEFEFDNVVNRIIKHTCKLVANLTDNKNNKKIVRNVLIRMNDVSDLPYKPSDCDGIRLSKINRNYSVILSMSKMFLLNKTSTYAIDTHESFCFLFPTELLFEGFVGGYFAEVLGDYAKVRLQASEMTLINNVVYDGKSLGKAFTMRHDILVEHKDKGVFILDTKYKHMARFEGNVDVKKTVTEEVKQGDLYQVIEYASHRDLVDVYLLYPMYRFEEVEPNDIILVRESVSKKQINVHVVRIPFVFENNDEYTKRNIRDTIYKIFG